MDQGRHRTATKHQEQLWRHLLPQNKDQPYPALVADDGKDIRRIRVDETLWKAYEDVVGNGGRSADLRSYIEWRVAHPTEPLPGQWRGPVKKVRASKKAADGKTDA